MPVISKEHYQSAKPSWMPNIIYDMLSDPTNMMIPLSTPIAGMAAQAIPKTRSMAESLAKAITHPKVPFQASLPLDIQGPMTMGASLAGKELKYTAPKAISEAVPEQLGLNSIYDPFAKMSQNVKAGMSDLGSKLNVAEMSQNPFKGVDIEAIAERSKAPFAGMFDELGNLKNAIAPKAAKAVASDVAPMASHAVGAVAKKPMSRLVKTGLTAGPLALGAAILSQLNSQSPNASTDSAQLLPSHGGAPSQKTAQNPPEPDFESLRAALQQPAAQPLFPMQQGPRQPLFPDMTNANMGAGKMGGNKFDWKTMLQIVGPLLAAIIATRG